MSSHVTSRRTVAGLLLACQVSATTGCTSWKTQQQGTEAVLAAHPELQRLDTTWVTQPNGSAVPSSVSGRSIRIATTSHPEMLLVAAPRVSGDTLFGITDDARKELGTPLKEITAVQLRQGSAGKTLDLVLVLAVPVGLVVGTMISASGMGL